MCQGLQSVPENFAQDQNTFGDIEGNEPAENEQKDQKQQKEPEKTEQKAAQLGSADAKDEEVLPDEKEMKVPTTFNEMLLFSDGLRRKHMDEHRAGTVRRHGQERRELHPLAGAV